MKNTYRDIIHEFKDFCNRHRMINQVIDDQTWDVETMSNLYPSVIIVPTTSTGNIGSLQVGFQIFFCDILQASTNNSRDVYSDMLEVAKDFIAYFTDREDWVINDDFTLTPFEERFDDIVGGWELECTVNLAFNHSVCDLPMDDEIIDVYPPEAYFTYSIIDDTIILYNKSKYYDDLSWDLPGSIEESLWYITPDKIKVKFAPGTWTITLTAKRQGFQDSTYSQIIEINE